MEASLELLKEQTKLLIGKTGFGFLDALYLKAGFSVILPRNSTFDTAVNGYGLGLFAGVGKYLGRHHVVDLELANDVHLGFTARYRFEIHLTNPLLTFGPVIGYRMKLANAPLENTFLAEPQKTKTSFFLLGVVLGIPFTKAMGVLELAYLSNRQAMLHLNAALHLFL